LKTPDHEAAAGALMLRVLQGHSAFIPNPVGDWAEIAGEQVAAYSQPVSLKKKVLLVIAYDSVWMHHIELNKEALIDNINRGRKEPLVEKINIRVGEVPLAPPVLNPNHRLLDKIEPKHQRPKKKKKAPQRPLTPEEKALLKSLTDPELRAVAKRLLSHIPLSDEENEERSED